MDYNGFLIICQQGIKQDMIITSYFDHTDGLVSLWDNVSMGMLYSKIEASDDASEVC